MMRARSVGGAIVSIVAVILSGPACGNECELGTSRCVDGGIETCVGVGGGEAGYDHYEKQWFACPDSYECVIATEQYQDNPPEEVALCAYGGLRDPRCDGWPEFCDGNVLASCRAGYVTQREQCPANEPYCIDVDSGRLDPSWPDDAFCAAADAPDPLCPDVPPEWSGIGYCDGTTYVPCFEGYPGEEISCAECTTDPDQPYIVVCSG
jgi:hypothetical protein